MPGTTPNTLPPTEPVAPVQNPVPTPEIPQSSSKFMWYILGGFVTLILLLGVLYVAAHKTSNTSMQSTTQLKPTLARSKPMGIVTNVITASSLDATGNATISANTFIPTQKTVYLVLIVNNPKVGTKFEYIRYLDNKLLDSGALKVTRPNLTNSSFAWTLKPGAIHSKGTYRVRVYTNGVFEKEISYTVS